MFDATACFSPFLQPYSMFTLTLTLIKNSGEEFALCYVQNFSPNRCRIGKSHEANSLHVNDLIGILVIHYASSKV